MDDIKTDPVTVYRLAAEAPCDPATARKAIEQGVDSLRRMTQARVRPAMRRLGLLPESAPLSAGQTPKSAA